MQQNLSQSFLKLVEIMSKLRKECPWDKKQTFKTLRNFTIEELYELIESIDSNDINGMAEELGDIFFHILFYAEIAQENNQFSLQKIIDNVTKKLISRHPHVFGNLEVKNEKEVKDNWEKIKLQEGRKSMLSGVPNALPALNKAMLIQEKAKQIGFEWENPIQVLQKIKEEITELEEAIHSNNFHNMEDELGDVLFSIINFSRYVQINADKALDKTNNKFKQRFQLMEELALQQNLSLASLNLTQQNELWEAAKIKINQQK
ncbi:MAG: nucleoside triphosphate pyrophosphohydrolase [Sediminibacterium sp.]|nr:nucleoside triphosphate pyrophosphohydrolase [Sediminibacterium sp.]